MTAGAVSVPTIVPLRAPIPGQHKTAIDTSTKIEIKSETPGVSIYYTINGSKPEPFRTIGSSHTYRYRGPFFLPQGKITVKSIAISGDGRRESHIVTKSFDVIETLRDYMPVDEDGLSFVNDLRGNETMQRAVDKFANDMVSSQEAWAEVRKMRGSEDHYSHNRPVRKDKLRVEDVDSFLDETEEMLRGFSWGPTTLPQSTDALIQDAMAAIYEDPLNPKPSSHRFKSDSHQRVRFSDSMPGYPPDHTAIQNGWNGISVDRSAGAPFTQPSPYPQRAGVEDLPPSIRKALGFQDDAARTYNGVVLNGMDKGEPSHLTFPLDTATSVNRVPFPKADKGIQTVAFFPSQAELLKKKEEEEEKLERMRDRRPLLTSVSPGRGYWRRQMEHICAHLKAQAQDNPEFRSLIAEPKMGKILSADVEEEEYEITLNITFAVKRDHSRQQEEILKRYAKSRSRIGKYGSRDSIDSTDRKKKVKKKRAVKKTSKQQETEDKLMAEDKLLLKEIGKSGDGRGSEVEQLIVEEGADPNCVNKDGYPALQVAVRNKQLDAIPVLVQEGADIHKKGPNRGNTALHEAVSISGETGREIVELLLQLGAKAQIKNDKGETAYDLATKEGREGVARLLAEGIGQSMLGKLTKPKPSKRTAKIF